MTSFLNMLSIQWMRFEFMRNAFFAVLVACPMFGALGTVVVSNHMSFFSDAIGHSALTGIALGVVLGIYNVTLSMVIFSILLGFAIITVKIKGKASADTIIGVFSSVSVALGIVLLSSDRKFAKYQKYLVGDILSIRLNEILFLSLASLLLLMVWIFFYNKMLLTSLHLAFAKSRGIRTFWIEQLFALLTAGIVTVCIRWTGLLVINSMLVLPAASSRLLSQSLRGYTLRSIFISLISGVLGLVFSYYANSATGASIVLLNSVFFFICLYVAFLKRLHIQNALK